MTTTLCEEPIRAIAARIKADPLNPDVIAPLFTLCTQPSSARSALSLLAQWSTHPNLPNELRGMIAYCIAACIRHDAGHFNPARFGVNPDLFDGAAIDTGLSHHLLHAVQNVDLLRRLEAGIPLRDAPKFIVAVQKSGSSLLADCVAGIVKMDRGYALEAPCSYRAHPRWWPLGKGHDWDLRADIGAEPEFLAFPGAIYKGHIPPSQKNLRILEIYRTSRYLICLRDPRDQAVADFCQSLRRCRNAGELVDEPTAEETRRRLDAFIKGGTVFEALHFVGKWLAERDPTRSLVVTYENLISEPIATLRNIAELYEIELPDSSLQQVWEFVSPTTDRRRGADRTAEDRRIYPLGWTGEIGIHKKYFDDTNAETFEKVFAGFDAAGPWGGEIRALYPDL
ncbi:MAG TPA: hypothetical protein ENK11_08840 [Phycisphaerales bacterium]|nr:hypothetical protein [Phycisphaerales bacterium]